MSIRPFLSGALVLAFAAAPLACAAKKQTEIVVVLQTDVPVPKDMDTVSIVVTAHGQEFLRNDYSLDPNDPELTFPATLAIDSAGDSSIPVQVEVHGKAGQTDRVIRSATVSFVSDQIIMLRMPLHFECFDLATSCGDGETCIGGACQPNAVQADSLPIYDQTLAFGAPNATNGNGCFDPTVCVPTWVTLAPTSGDPCVFDLANTTPTNGRTIDPTKPVSLLLKHTGANGYGFCDADSCKVPLDYDAVEGWTYADDAKTKARLAPGICARLKKGDGLFDAVGATDQCGTKTPATPFCK